MTLFRNGVRARFMLHRLVLEAFVGPCPEGMEGCHNDGDPANNSLSNLRWDTHSSNIRDKRAHGTDHNAMKTSCLRDHPFTPANTYVARNGHRSCRTCRRAAVAAYKARKKSRLAA